MEELRELSKTEIVLAFAASCVESVARVMSISYLEAFEKLERMNLFDSLVFPHYETMHTESREVVTQRLVELLSLDS